MIRQLESPLNDERFAFEITAAPLEGFDGVLVFEGPILNGRYEEFTLRVTLEPGESRTVHLTPAQTDSWRRSFVVSLINRNGRRVAEISGDPTTGWALPSESAVDAVLVSEAFSRASPLWVANDGRFGSEFAGTLWGAPLWAISATPLPDWPVVVLRSSTFSMLPPPSKASLAAFTRAGGTVTIFIDDPTAGFEPLLAPGSVSLGPAAQAELPSALDELISARAQREQQVPGPRGARQPSATRPADGAESDGTAQVQSQALVRSPRSAAGTPLLLPDAAVGGGPGSSSKAQLALALPVGRGWVVLVGAAPEAIFASDANLNAARLASQLANGSSSGGVNDPYINWSSEGSEIDRLLRLGDFSPPIGVVPVLVVSVLLVALFGLLAGPIDFLVLRRGQRRAFSWFTAFTWLAVLCCLGLLAPLLQRGQRTQAFSITRTDQSTAVAADPFSGAVSPERHLVTVYAGAPTGVRLAPPSPAGWWNLTAANLWRTGTRASSDPIRLFVAERAGPAGTRLSALPEPFRVRGATLTTLRGETETADRLGVVVAANEVRLIGLHSDDEIISVSVTHASRETPLAEIEREGAVRVLRPTLGRGTEAVPAPSPPSSRMRRGIWSSPSNPAFSDDGPPRATLTVLIREGTPRLSIEMEPATATHKSFRLWRLHLDATLTEDLITAIEATEAAR